MSNTMMTVIPVVIYLAMSFGVALWARKKAESTTSSKGFIEDYFIGGRSMGGMVLAMTIIASYTSASSFVGGPGVAYKLGLSWVLLAMIQVPTTFLTLGILGKRFAIMARKTDSVTITDFLRARYKSDAVVILCSVALIVFFMAAMLAQFIGGARLFQTVTGYPYIVGLVLFGVSVVLYTAIGGFRAVVLTDAIQGIVMVVAVVVILLAVINAGGGMENCIQSLKAIDPGLITPTGPKEAVPQPFTLSFWVLVGIGILGLPQTTQRCMGYRDSKAMHDAMIIGTLLIGFMILCAHLAGTLGRAILPELPAGDLAMPSLIVELLSPVWAGVFIAGPLAAIMSTVDSMLLLVSAAIIKDLYIHYRLKGDASRMTLVSLKKMSLICTVVVGLMVFVAAIEPPDLLVWINLFAFGGLEAAFLCPIVIGLYWDKANSTGAISSIVIGVGTFIALTIMKPAMGGVHAIVPTTLASLTAFVLGSYAGHSKTKSDRTPA
ncbi:sodium/pantothenate symporter [Maridesulfovibrio salexigens]|uniref:Sodium/pantothenate symporter n=1 Tax=Maridesulfovibrio salexigens (strain ATCC 14822 / DSM 2638 / NCIMB 8403 / VKM B-1763) TaxID=526222 RepID=C6BYU2_MARSD|nr:sodium/pantothenate symporter [Maridesulfovibrio salexigens]ACS80699.1 sodium/pantothenate symporter [Maridesulfovibrio salexigens DSM 2638]